jgi:hypothetical protein
MQLHLVLLLLLIVSVLILIDLKIYVTTLQRLYPEAATIRTENGKTVLSIAFVKRYFAIAEYLLKQCPQTASIPAEAQKTPLHQGTTCSLCKSVYWKDDLNFFHYHELSNPPSPTITSQSPSVM